MQTKAKDVEKVKTPSKEVPTKKPKLSSLRRRKKRGDKLGTVELSNEDGFTTDDEDDDGDTEGQYEGCKHFEVESKHVEKMQSKHLCVQEKIKKPVSSKKRKTLKKKTMKIKVEVKVRSKPGTVKVCLEDTAKLAKKKKLLKKKKEMKKLLLAKNQSREKTKQQNTKMEERKKKDASDIDIKTENISDDEKQGKSCETEITEVRKRGRPPKTQVEVEDGNERLPNQGTETKLKERKRKGQKIDEEEAEKSTNTKGKKKKQNVDIDKLDLETSSKEKKGNVDNEQKVPIKISKGKKKADNVDNGEMDPNTTTKGKKKADNVDNGEIDPNTTTKGKKNAYNEDSGEMDTGTTTKGKKKKTEEICEVVVDQRNVDPSREKFVGAHVSIAGGIYKSVLEAVAMKSFAFGLFLKSQRQWACKALEDMAAEKFRETCQEYGFLPQYIVPHGSYLMNLGSPDENTLEKSRDSLIDDLQRCEKLGLTLFNFHPGSTCGKISVEKCLDNIAESINIAHSKTSGVITVLENMSCQGHTVGGKFEELRGIIDRVTDKSRMGVCLDTCHAFAAGFDLSTEAGFNQMVSNFESIVGFQYLKAMHLNDSQGKVGCHLDRHENIGKGHIGKAGFKRIMNCPKFNHIPMILETPCADDDSYAKEVKMLYGMCNS